MDSLWTAIVQDPGKFGLAGFSVILNIYLLTRARSDRAEIIALTKSYEEKQEGLIKTMTLLSERLEK